MSIDAFLKNVNPGSLSFDSRKVDSNSVFFAIRGASSDGHRYLPQVCTLNPKGLVVEDTQNIPASYSGAVLHVTNTREALDRAAAHFYRRPSRELTVYGVTGTNGKTTTTHIIEHLSHLSGAVCGVLGTIDHHLGSKVWDSQLTTPDPITLQMRLREMKDLGAHAVAMEVSSHALDQRRVDSVEFDVGVFTNLTRDHLDYHGSFENYFAAKNRLFNERLTNSSKKHPWAIINADDPWSEKITTGAKRLTFGFSPSANIRIGQPELGFWGARFSLDANGKTLSVESSLIGEFNIHNAVGALLAVAAGGLSDAPTNTPTTTKSNHVPDELIFRLQTLLPMLAKFMGVSGRLEKIPSQEVAAFVDYAHTDDALRSVLKTLVQVRTQSQAQSQIVTVFGCGGDRDKGKRPLMMRAALDASDVVIVTSDNPRNEDPKAIIRDALAAVRPDEKTKVVSEVDRAAALQKAVEIAKKGDVILVAGKGHETYQQIGDQKFPFSDQKILAKLLQR
jgi:UDP-N-acetylmuramoyl-L-alanyl-D-glutamate--2,6-diaminopimelate ligase